MVLYLQELSEDILESLTRDSRSYIFRAVILPRYKTAVFESVEREAKVAKSVSLILYCIVRGNVSLYAALEAVG